MLISIRITLLHSLTIEILIFQVAKFWMPVQHTTLLYIISNAQWLELWNILRYCCCKFERVGNFVHAEKLRERPRITWNVRNKHYWPSPVIEMYRSSPSQYFILGVGRKHNNMLGYRRLQVFIIFWDHSVLFIPWRFRPVFFLPIHSPGVGYLTDDEIRITIKSHYSTASGSLTIDGPSSRRHRVMN